MIGAIDWRISVDSTIVRAHQHAAGASLCFKGGAGARAEHQDETPWQSLYGRLVEAVVKTRAGRTGPGGPGSVRLEGRVSRRGGGWCQRFQTVARQVVALPAPSVPTANPAITPASLMANAAA